MTISMLFTTGSTFILLSQGALGFLTTTGSIDKRFARIHRGQPPIMPSVWDEGRNHCCLRNRFRRHGWTYHSPTITLAIQSAPPVSSLRALVSPDDAWGNWAVLSGAAAAAQVLGTQTAIGRLLGPPVTAMTTVFLLASTGILHPGGTLAAKSMQLFCLQLATPLILLGADLRDAAKQCGPLLISFAMASLATLIAAVVGWRITGVLLSDALGPDGLIIAAALLAKNIGGGINYIAICQSLNASPMAVAAGLCIDNIFALLYFPATSALAAGRPDVVKDEVPSIVTNVTMSDLDDAQEHPISIPVVSNVLFLVIVLLWIGQRFGGSAGALPLCTLLTVVVASWTPRKWIQPLQPAANTLGMVCLYLFFATAGAPGIAVADSVRASIVPLGLFLGCVYGIHAMILGVLHRIWGKQLEAFRSQRLLVASSAAIGGPATALALAQAAGWKTLQVPSLLVGNIGYAVATFMALGYHRILTPS